MNFTKTRTCAVHDIDKVVGEITRLVSRDTDAEIGTYGQRELIGVTHSTYRDYKDTLVVVVTCLFKDSK